MTVPLHMLYNDSGVYLLNSSWWIQVNQAIDMKGLNCVHFLITVLSLDCDFYSVGGLD